MRITILLLLTLLVTSLKGQNIDFDKLEYSFNAGPSLNFVSGDIPSDIESNAFVGWQFGFETSYKIDENWVFLSGLNVSKKGGNILTEESYDYTDQFGDSASSVESLEQQIRLAYLNLPLSISYIINPKFQIGGGLQFGYLISARSTLEYTDQAFPSDNESVSYNMLENGSFNFLGLNFNYQKSLNRVELSGNLFSRYKLTDKLTAILQINLGLTKIDDRSTTFTDSGNNFDSLNLKNRSIILGVNYKLGDIF